MPNDALVSFVSWIACPIKSVGLGIGLEPEWIHNSHHGAIAVFIPAHPTHIPRRVRLQPPPELGRVVPEPDRVQLALRVELVAAVSGRVVRPVGGPAGV